MIEVSQITAFEASGNTQQIVVWYYGVTGSILDPFVFDDWISITTASTSSTAEYTVIAYDITVSANASYPRSSTISFNATGAGQLMQGIYQSSSASSKTVIGEDCFYTVTGLSIFNYDIDVDGESAYSGRAVRAPKAAGIDVNISDVARSYVTMEISDFRGVSDDVIPNSDAYRKISLVSEYGMTIMSWDMLYQYMMDWSGETLYNMSQPINGHLDPRMKILHTVYNDNITNIQYEI